MKILMWAIGVEGDKYRPHEMNEECGDEGCQVITADEVQAMYSSQDSKLDGRSLYTLLYVATVNLADPNTTFSGIKRAELEAAVLNTKQILETLGYVVPVVVRIT